MPLATPYYLIDESALARNLERVDVLRAASGAKCLLALKCFATWSTFPQIAPHMDGTTSSSLNELKLGREKFGGETHAYSVAWSDGEIDEAIANADKIIFNSIGQLERFDNQSASIQRGLRLNPRFSTSGFDLADPARPFSRLGEWDAEKIAEVVDRISGFMIHYNCENRDFDLFDRQLGRIETEFARLLERVQWVSLGGGIHFTGEGYPVDDLAARLRAFSKKFGVQVYLEPGEAAITNSTTLEVSPLDAQKLVLGQQLGQLSLVLRKPGEEQNIPRTEAVSLDDLRYTYYRSLPLGMRPANAVQPAAAQQQARVARLSQPRRAAPVRRATAPVRPSTSTVSVTRGLETKDYEVGGYAH